MLFFLPQDVAPCPSPRCNVLLRRPSTTTSLLYSPFVPTSFSVPPSTTMPLSVSHPRGEGAIGRPYRAHVTRERLMSARALSFPRQGIGTVLAALTGSSSIGVRRRKIRAVSSLRSSATISALLVALATVACSLFRLLPRSDCPSPSSVSDVRLASPHEEHPVPSRSLLLQTRNAIDSLAL